MTFRSGLLAGLLLGIAATAAAWLATTWRRAEKVEKPASSPPAEVGQVVKETELNTIVLTAAAVQRLNLQTTKVVRESVRPLRTFGGEVIVKPGTSAVVTAPVSGLFGLRAEHCPSVGSSWKAGDALFEITPIVSPEGRANLATALVDALGQIQNAETQVSVTQIALERARRVYQSEAGSRRAMEEAQAAHDVAKQSLAALQSRSKALQRIAGEIESGNAGPIELASPEDGVLRALNAVPGQTVAAGTALFEIVDLDRVWVRVPVFVGDELRIDFQQPLLVGDLTFHAQQADRQATFIDAPASANALTSTIDLACEVANEDRRFRLGERVSVKLRLKGEDSSLTIPSSAVVYDVYGGTWVYVEANERTYARRRVVMKGLWNDKALIAAGLGEGETVVSEGAAELFGAETGFTK
jgi:RND family efflux transporter MFP subunit